MSKGRDLTDEKTWWLRYFLVLAVLWTTAWLHVGNFEALLFNTITQEAVLQIFLPVLALAIFIERAVEVYVNTHRESGKLEAKGHGSRELETYKTHTRRKAFLMALTLGTLVSLVGMRVLFPLVSADFVPAGLQGRLFGMVDVVITAAMLAGGAEPIHKLMLVLTGYLNQMRPAAHAQQG